MATNVEIPILVSREKAAALLGVSVRSVDRLRDAGRLHAIQYVEGGRIRYRLGEVEALLEPETRATRYGVRQVPLSPGVARQLWTLLATADDDGLVFSTSSGASLDRSKLYAMVRAAGVRAGIEWPVGLHVFRHSAASIMFRRGVPKEAIRRPLGHHSWDFTAGTYLHLDDDDLPDGAVVGDLTATAVSDEVQEAALQA